MSQVKKQIPDGRFFVHTEQGKDHLYYFPWGSGKSMRGSLEQRVALVRDWEICIYNQDDTVTRLMWGNGDRPYIQVIGRPGLRRIYKDRNPNSFYTELDCIQDRIGVHGHDILDMMEEAEKIHKRVRAELIQSGRLTVR